MMFTDIYYLKAIFMWKLYPLPTSIYLGIQQQPHTGDRDTESKHQQPAAGPTHRGTSSID